ncbi:F-box protein cpr1 [Thalictrum thalictroides]|uniref:F-box protein cpr1 n=1 Tax=Thalictrum thalictroides TaxID=46969 RepID=A0A7J6VUG2_THATH|nr:F-box protein cpr1 [Thalictrum thalictroides]
MGTCIGCLHMKKPKTIAQPTEPRLPLIKSFKLPTELNKNLQVLCNSYSALYLLDNEASDHKDLLSDHTPEITSRPIQFWGSCNGLLLVTTRRKEDLEDMYLWNPCTHEFMKIPYTKTSPKHNADHQIAFGLGYNEVSKDYEILRVLSYSADKVYYSEVEVFSLRTNSWRRIEDIPYIVRSINYMVKQGELVNGALHWAVYHSRAVLVIAYDVKDEKFTEVVLPAVYDKTDLSISIHVAALHEYLCVSFHYENHAEAWIMMEYGMKDSWKKLYDITEASTTCRIDSEHLKPLCFMKEKSEILLCDHTSLYVYDTEDRSLRGLIVENHPERVYQATTYTESTVRLHQENTTEI